MKTLTSAMQALIASDSITLATCVKILRQDGIYMGFTDWTDNIWNVLGDSITYLAGSFTRSAVSTPSDLSVPAVEIEGMLETGAITDADIAAGVYDFAQFWTFMMVPIDNGATTYGIIKLRRGWFGQIDTNLAHQHKTELRGLAQLLTQNYIETFTLDCQADFCDSRCQLNPATYTYSGTISGVTNNRSFAASDLGSDSLADGFFNLGLITWATGNNTGLSMEIKTWTNAGGFTLFLPMGKTVQVGDTFTAIGGCNKSLTACQSFNNVINMRGFPYIPGLDATLYPNAAFQNSTQALD